MGRLVISTLSLQKIRLTQTHWWVFFLHASRLPSLIVILQDLEHEEVLVSSASEILLLVMGGGGDCLALIVFPQFNQENSICGHGTLPDPLISNRVRFYDQLYFGSEE